MDQYILNETLKRFEPASTACAFCTTGAQSTSMDDNCFSPVYRVKDRTNLVVYRNVKFNEVKIGIPRCQRCRKIHGNVKAIGCITMLVGIFLVFAVPVFLAVLFDASKFGIVVMLVATFGLVYWGMTSIEKAILASYKVKSEIKGAKEDPLVGEFLKTGWTLDRPRA